MDRDSLGKVFTELYDLVVRLRSPGGCPWDAKQTYRTLRMYLLEEAYEALDAVEKGEPGEIRQELGDLLFQIVFISYLGEERGEFDLLGVLRNIREKMIRRHPHVFGSSTVESAEEVAAIWAGSKKREKEEEGEPASPFETVPVALPSLLRAHRLGERAAKAGLEEESDEIRSRIRQGVGALEQLDREKGAELFREKMGDLLFDLAALTRTWGFNSEDLLRAANQRFVDRFRNVGTDRPGGR
jgi:tetrapyrrole methylase family protein / MazG family protein